MEYQFTYTFTNENIYAVKKGLKPSLEDNILAIAGSFDIPFMFLENDARVTAVDIHTNQLDFGAQRIEYLKKGLINQFNVTDLDDPENKNIGLRNKYFLEINHEKVKNNLSKLSSVQGNFMNFNNARDYNKVYMSNVLDHIGADFSSSKHSMMVNFFEKFSSGTRFYMTAGNIASFEKIPSLHKHEKLSAELSARDDFWNVYVLTKK